MRGRTLPGGTAQGVVLMCIGVALLSFNDAFAKTLTANYAPLQILFLRNLIALPFAVLIALRMGGTSALFSSRPKAHLLRGAMWILATVMFFTSFRYLPLAEATALLFVAPLFITALSALLFGEAVGKFRWTAILAGFAGVLIVVRPGGATFEAVSLLPIGAALLYAFMMLSARWLEARESVWTVLLYLTGTGALMSGLIVFLVWKPVRIEDLWLFMAIAFFGTAGMTMMTQAFRSAPASVVAPLEYSALLWATGLGWLIWDEVPDQLTFLGAAIVIASGMVIIWRERRRRRT